MVKYEKVTLTNMKKKKCEKVLRKELEEEIEGGKERERLLMKEY